MKAAKDWCEFAKYSPCEDFLAIGSRDNHLYIFSVDAETHEYKLHFDFEHQSWMNAIDWTADSKEIRASTGGNEVLYFNMESKQPDPNGSESAKDKVWASNTVKYGEDRQGIFLSDE